VGNHEVPRVAISFAWQLFGPAKKGGIQLPLFCA
jgi:hypothetical protein